MMIGQDEQKKIILLGDTGVGKTSILKRWLYNDFSQEEPTIGAQNTYKTYKVDDTFVKLSLWDTAGQEQYKSIAPLYVRGANLAMIVVDASSLNSFASIPMWAQMVKECDTGNPIILYLVVNKMDLIQEEGTDACNEQIKLYAKNFNLMFYVSARTGENINFLFDSCAEDVAGLKNTKDPNVIFLNPEQQITVSDNERKCCYYQ